MFLQGILVFIVKLLSSSFNPLLLLFMQYAGGLIGVIIYVLVKKFKLTISKHELFLALLSGFLVSTGLSFYYIAIRMAPVSLVSPLQSVGIMLMQGILGFTILKEKVTLKTILGFISAILCIIFLTI
ncbi:EamA-like transporter family protein [Candidatus Tiddalikarchaeum anstoanum]|nr:EamA-like transporter family protein [Candidatus Tiddalikarchaeum anstoanum]